MVPPAGLRTEEHVRVGLQNAREIAPTLLKRDYDRLRANGYTGGWFFAIHEDGKHEIRIEHNGEYLSAARLILGVSEDAPVTFHNGQTLDLILSNLSQ